MRSWFILLVLVVYAVVMGIRTSGFGVVWDDRPLVHEADLEPVGEALQAAWTSDFWSLAPETDRFESGMYRPVVTTTYILERWAGWGSGGAHVVNLMLHLCVVVLVGLLAAELGLPSGWAALLFLVHPHASGLLGNVAARTDLLATLGVVGALTLVRRQRLGWGAVVLALGALSKETALVGVILWWWVDWAEFRREPKRCIWPLLALGAVLGLRSLVVGSIPDMQLGAESGLLVGLSSTGWAYLDLLVPRDVGPWPAPHLSWPGFIGLAVALGVSRWSRFGAVWVLICWLPTAGWFPLEVRESSALLYLPAVGLALVWAGVMKARPRPAVLLASVVLLGLAGAQYRALSPWTDSLSLWSWGVETNPTDPLPQVNLGRVHAEAGRLELARIHYTNAASLAQARHDATFFVKAAYSLGELALLEGDTDGANVYFSDAVSVAGAGNHPPSEQRLLELAAPEKQPQ